MRTHSVPSAGRSRAQPGWLYHFGEPGLRSRDPFGSFQNRRTYRTFYVSIPDSKMAGVYRGASLMRDNPPVGPYSSPVPRDIW